MADTQRSIPIVEIPRNIGGPPQLLFWELDEVIIFALCIGVGILTRTLTWMLLLSLVITRIFSNWKMGQLPGILAHMVYWYGFSSLNPVFRRGDVRHYVE
jgi:type IV conjugative transfer system protein TraL